MAEDSGAQVKRNERAGQFEAQTEGGPAVLTYGITEGRIFLLHTEVPAEAEGQGIGSKLVRASLDYARGENLRVVAMCPFAKAYIERHPDEYGDLVAEEG